MIGLLANYPANARVGISLELQAIALTATDGEMDLISSKISPPRNGGHLLTYSHIRAGRKNLRLNSFKQLTVIDR